MKSSLVLGHLIGEGVARRVHAWLPDPNMVAKLQTRESLEDRDYQNIAEYTLWTNANEKVRKYLAPVHYISPCGSFMLQARCGEIRRPDMIPDKIPKVLADAHPGNWGWLDGKPVLVDYGRHWAVEMACNAKGMVSVNNDDTPSIR